MPQKPYDWVNDDSYETDSYGSNSSQPDWENDPKEQTWTQWLISQGLRTVPSVAGTMLGAATAPVTGPAGAVLGGIGGGALGEGLAEWYEGKKLNPDLMALEGALNAVPFIGEVPGVGAGFRQIGRYAGSAALQGGVQGALGTIPRHAIEADKFELPSFNEFAGGGLGGAAFGGITGAAHAGIGPGLRAIGSIVKEPQLHEYYQPNLDLGLPHEPQPTNQYLPGMEPPVWEGKPAPEPTPFGFAGMGRNPQQASFDFQSESPHYNEGGQGLLFDPRPPSRPPSPPIDPVLMDQMIHPSTRPPTDPPTVPPSEPPPTVPPVIEGESPFQKAMKAAQEIQRKSAAFNEHEVAAGNTVELPTKNITPEVIQNMKEGGYELVSQTPEKTTFREVTSEEMRVPGHKEGNTGLENVAVGGVTDPRLLDVLASSLYSRPRPITTIKELLQNAFDEHKEARITEPVKVLIDKDTVNPQTKESTKSITVRDKGRGLTTDQIYTVLTDMGSTGKEGVESAAGGFGLAKAAPILGGKYVKITSVVDTPKGRMKYTFEGNPSELKNMARGVALNAEKVKNTIPTGLEVTTHYDPNETGFHEVGSWAKNMAERSPSVTSGIELAEMYQSNPTEARRWLDETSQNPITKNEYNYIKHYESKIHKSESMPTLMDTIDAPGAKVNIHYDITPGVEASQADIHLTNKGMYQGTNELSYGGKTPNVPRSIVADINAIVEEGHSDYPFSANREQIKEDVTRAINKWVRENIISGVTKKRVAEVQRQYDAIAPVHENGETDIHYLDDGGRLTRDELNHIVNHPKMVAALKTIEGVQAKLMGIADSLGWQPQSWSADWKVPSERLKKFGLLFESPDASNGSVTLGIHIPRPDDMNNSAILINLMEHLNAAVRHENPIDQLVTTLHTTMTHEIAHVPGGSHDTDFAYRDAELHSKSGRMNTNDLLDELGRAFDDGNGNIDPQISDLLPIYNESRTRDASKVNDVLASGIHSKGRSNPGTGANQGATSTSPSQVKPSFIDRVKENTGWGQGASATGTQKKSDVNYVKEALALPSAATTTLDLSAPGRQGLSQILTPEFWKASYSMFKGLSPEAYKVMDDDLRSRPIFQDKIDQRTGKKIPSFAKQAGMKLYQTASNAPMGNRAEGVASRWLEQGIGTGPIATGYKNTIGVPIRATNRAYITFLNQLNANRFEKLVNTAQNMSLNTIQNNLTGPRAGVLGGMELPGIGRVGLNKKYTPEEAMNLNPYHNLVLAKEIADFVNTATGHGPLKMHVLPFKQTEISLESAADKLSLALFSPGLIASRLRMTNPSTYIMASPFVRKQYMKAAVSTAAAWFMFTEMAKLAGGDEVTVNNNITSADFGKVRIGDTRMDPGGGFLQFLTAYGRLWNGGSTSSSTGQFHRFGSGYQAQTQEDMMERFMVNKLNPVAKFAYDLGAASQYNPFHVGDRVMQLFTPLVLQDLKEIASENPDLLPWMAPVSLGMGTQTYSKGESVGKLVPPENDWLVTGGGLRDLFPGSR